MSAQPQAKTDYISPEEYIEWEIASDVKHDYFNGQVLERITFAEPTPAEVSTDGNLPDKFRPQTSR